MSPDSTTTAVLPGERIDQIAQRVYGDPYQYQLIIAANPTLDIYAPQAGKLIEVPSA